MKKFVQRICLALVLVMLFSMMPMAAFATEVNDGEGVEGEPAPANTNITVTAQCYLDASLKTLLGTYGIKELSAPSVTIDSATFGRFITFNGRIYEFAGVIYNNKLPANLTLATGGTHEINVCYKLHYHSYRPAHNRTYHWDGCACGSIINKEKHVDPATDEDSICTCGYEFSHNADLVTLWLKDIVFSERFNRETTEYTGQVYTYKNVTSTRIAVRTFDALATVELPSDLSIHDGLNQFEITVTAEDRKTTKTYIVYAYRASDINGTVVTSEAGATLLTPDVTVDMEVDQNHAIADIASAAMEEAAAQAEINGSEKIVITPNIRSYRMTRIDVIIPAEDLAALVENNDAAPSLQIVTKMGRLTIPGDVLAELVEGTETLTVTFRKANNQVSYTILTDGEEVAEPSEDIILSRR